MVRVTEAQRFYSLKNNVARAREDNLDTLNQVASQKRITHLHEDPIGANKILRSRSRLSELDSFVSNLNFGKGFVNTTEKSLSLIQDSLIRIKELSVAAASDTFDSQSRMATAAEINELLNGIVQIANTRFGAKYIFSGFRTDTPAIDRDGVFLGDDGEIFLQIGAQNFQRVNIPGREVFEIDPSEYARGHIGMIPAISSLRQGLATDNKTQIYKAMEDLDFHSDRLTTHLANIGAIFNTLERTSQQLQLNKDLQAESLSHIEDVDLFQASSDFKRTEQVLQGTLQATNKMMQPSLLNYIR